MGAGASSSQGVEELLTTTFMIGKAIAAVTFPGMYRIYSFHSPKAPRLKTQRQFALFVDSDEEDEDDDYIPPEQSKYGHMVRVKVGEDTIYIENILEPNEAGWLPLHSCCMSNNTIEAGLTLIDEMVQRGGDLNVKTLAGPGSFNSGWTPLHMACAYGVEPLVEKLISEGADVNVTNSFGYTPLLDACHRGYLNIVLALIKGGADLSHLPSTEEALSSPFMSAPTQTPLGEAARCGYPRIVQALISAGADKDQRNSLGWTALHEACFYNQVESAKTLLLSGANPCIRTKRGALPYHLSGLQTLRAMLEDMGGAEARAGAGDEIDMLAILKELSVGETTIIADSEGNLEVVRIDPDDQEDLGAESCKKPNSSLRIEASSPKNKKVQGGKEDKVREPTSPSLLHSGPLLGDLPSLSPTSALKAGHKAQNMAQGLGERLEEQFDDALMGEDSPHKGKKRFTTPQSASSLLATSSVAPTSEIDSRSKGKKKTKSKRKEELPPDFPKAYLCQLSERPLSDPVRSIYGHTYEKTAILSWLKQQGRICPLTGAPLTENDLKPLPELGEEIRDWMLQKSSSTSNSSKPIVTSSPLFDRGHESKGKPSHTQNEDDLYDF